MAVVVEIRGSDGGRPYRVRHDSGHESVVYPGVAERSTASKPFIRSE
jgi:hypothetical protein